MFEKFADYTNSHESFAVVSYGALAAGDLSLTKVSRQYVCKPVYAFHVSRRCTHLVNGTLAGSLETHK